MMKRFAVFALSAALTVPAAFALGSSQAKSPAQHALRGSQFRHVHVSVQNGIATLTGTVPLFADKMNAADKIRHVHGVTAIRNNIRVDGPNIPDRELEARLQKKIAYGLLGYFPVEFQSIGVQVHNGVVTLGGNAAGPIAASDAVAIVRNTKGVKDVIDDIHVDPVSPLDERIRVAEFHAIYSDPMLNQYAIDPEKPIRIQVDNGHVTLYGMVDTQGEKTEAGIRANTVPGVFSVKNDLQVASQHNERPSKH
jgi:osmotically-inducible protein OsmY